MKNNCFSGIITALITPFTKNDKIDYDSFEKLLLYQLEARVSGIVLFGTTGEGISLKNHERKSLLLFAKNVLANKIPIIAGISSPTTYKAIEQVEFYNKLGVKNLLITTPFYYKVTEEGVYKHFSKIVSSCESSVIIYNVPSRTNCDISLMPQILKELEKESKIIGIKHAGMSLENSLELLNKTSLPLFCGNDKYLYELIKNGYKGAISVFSNVLPQKAQELFNLITLKRWHECETILKDIDSLLIALENEPNPIPIKYATTLLTKSESYFRLPLTKASKSTKDKINNFFNGYSVKL